MSETKSLHFSVQGEFITNMAREKLYYNNDLFGAIDLIMNCTITEEISYAERLTNAIKILNGELQIVGTYPNDDYRIVPSEQSPQRTIRQWFQNLIDTIQNAKAFEYQTNQQLLCINDIISDRDKMRINLQWKDEYDGKTPIFPDVEYANAFVSSTENALLDDFIEHTQNQRDDDYGWLEPNGTFHSVEWGEHQSFAFQWLKNHNLLQNEFCVGNEGDILLEKGWILLHNPSLGTAIVTKNDIKPITKKQSEFLFNYYTIRNKNSIAKQYLNENDS